MYAWRCTQLQTRLTDAQISTAYSCPSLVTILSRARLIEQRPPSRHQVADMQCMFHAHPGNVPKWLCTLPTTPSVRHNGERDRRATRSFVQGHWRASATTQAQKKREAHAPCGVAAMCRHDSVCSRWPEQAQLVAPRDPRKGCVNAGLAVGDESYRERRNTSASCTTPPRSRSWSHPARYQPVSCRST